MKKSRALKSATPVPRTARIGRQGWTAAPCPRSGMESRVINMEPTSWGIKAAKDGAEMEYSHQRKKSTKESREPKATAVACLRSRMESCVIHMEPTSCYVLAAMDGTDANS